MIALERQADRDHDQRGRQRTGQVMMPGRLTPLAGQAAVTGQDQPQPDQEHGDRRAGQPKVSRKHGHQRPDATAAVTSDRTPTVSRFSAISVVWYR